jgi:hypothetical protein
METMEDKYLWDRSGEPDPEVQKLEEILGTLRYQAQSLEIPQHIQVGRRRSFSPALAIAAALAFFAILLGLWFGFHRRQTAPALEAKHDSQIDQQINAPQPQPVPGNQPLQAAVVKSPKPAVIEKGSAAQRNFLAARDQSRSPRAEIREPRLTPRELAEKEQVLVALRLVSAKLNLAQRKTQGVPQLNTIRNQHKIG